jgi:hypothetical protein
MNKAQELKCQSETRNHSADTFAGFDACDHQGHREKAMGIGDASHYLARMAEEVPPCLACGFARMCRDQKLACRVFEQFVDRGKFDRDEPKRPISKIYHRLFPDEGDMGGEISAIAKSDIERVALFR